MPSNTDGLPEISEYQLGSQKPKADRTPKSSGRSLKGKLIEFSSLNPDGSKGWTARVRWNADREPTDQEKAYFIEKSHRNAQKKVADVANAPLDLKPSLLDRAEEFGSQFIQSLDPRTNIYRTAEGIKRIATGKPFETKEFPLLPPEQAPEFYEQRRQEDKLPPSTIAIPKPGGGFWTPDATGLMEAGRGVMGLASLPGILYGGARGLIGSTIGGMGAQEATRRWGPKIEDPRGQELLETGAGLVGSVLGGGLAQVGKKGPVIEPSKELTTTPKYTYRGPGDIIGAPYKQPEGYTPPPPEQPPFEPQRTIAPPGEVRYQEGETLPQLAPPERVFYQGPVTEAPRGQLRIAPPSESPGSVIEPEFSGETRRVTTPKEALTEATKAAPFYSQLGKVAQSLPEQGRADKILQTLMNQGVSKDELGATGIGQFLTERGKQSVTRQEIIDQIKPVEIKPIWKRGAPEESREELSRLAARSDEIFDQLEVVRRRHSRPEPWNWLQEDPEWISLSNERAEINRRMDELSLPKDEPRHQGQMPPGGTNFRNLLITGEHPETVAENTRIAEIQSRLKEITQDPNFDQNERTRPGSEYRRLWSELDSITPAHTKYTSPEAHFAEPNIIAHALVQDHVGPDGSKILNAGEFQSDWAAAIQHGEKVPKSIAPKTSQWVLQVLKHLINEAVSGGYDKIAWPNGDWQRQKYGLSKHLDRLIYIPGSSTLLGTRGGDTIIEKPMVTPAHLPELVGRDIAQKLLSQPLNTEPSDFAFAQEHMHPHQELSGIDLDIGGKHLTEIYDRMAPDVANKYLKKLGIKTKLEDIGVHDEGMGGSVEERADGTFSIIDDEGNETGNFNTRQQAELNIYKSIPHHTIDVTPELVQAIERQGQQTFGGQLDRVTLKNSASSDMEHETRNITCESPCKVDLKNERQEPEFNAPADFFSKGWQKAQATFGLMDRFLAKNPLAKPVVDLMRKAYFNNIGWKSKVFSDLSMMANAKGIKWNRFTSEGKANRKLLFDYMNGVKTNIPEDIMKVGDSWRVVLDDVHQQLIDAGVRKGEPIGYLNDYISHIYKDNFFPELNRAIRLSMDSALKMDFPEAAKSLFSRKTETLRYKAEGEGGGIYEKGLKDVPESPFVKKRTGREQELIQDPFKVMRIYVDSVGKMLHFTNAVRDANEILRKLPDADPVSKDAARWFIEHSAGIENRSEMGRFAKSIDSGLAKMGARSVLTFHPMLQWFHLMRGILQGYPELGFHDMLEGYKSALFNDRKGAFNRAKEAGLLQAWGEGTSMKSPGLFKGKGEIFDFYNSLGDMGNTLTKMAIHEGVREKFKAAGMADPNSQTYDPLWEQKAVHEVARIEGITGPASHSWALEKIPRIFTMFQYWKQQYGENFGKAMLDAASSRFQDKEALMKAGRYMGAASAAIGLTAATGIPFMHLKVGTGKRLPGGLEALGFGSPQADSLANIIGAATKGDLSTFVAESARFAVPGGARILKKQRVGPPPRPSRPHRPRPSMYEYRLTPPS